jgi:hypothetical protein
MKPSTGRIVVTQGIITCNGTNEHPAIVNRVWSNEEPAEAKVLINCTVFPDLEEATHGASIQMFETREAAQAARAADPNTAVAFWPDRV